MLRTFGCLMTLHTLSLEERIGDLEATSQLTADEREGWAVHQSFLLSQIIEPSAANAIAAAAATAPPHSFAPPHRPSCAPPPPHGFGGAHREALDVSRGASIPLRLLAGSSKYGENLPGDALKAGGRSGLEGRSAPQEEAHHSKGATNRDVSAEGDAIPGGYAAMRPSELSVSIYKLKAAAERCESAGWLLPRVSG
jgi:hypothetical protein